MPVRAVVVVPVRADVVVPVRPGRRGRQQCWGELPLSSYQSLIFVQVLSRDDVNYFYISIKLVATSASYVGCETIGLTEPCSIGRATCNDFAVKSDCVDFLSAVLSFVKRWRQLFLYFYQIGSCNPLKTAQTGAHLRRTGCERASRCDRRRSWGETLLFDFHDFNFHVSFVKRRCQSFLSFYCFAPKRPRRSEHIAERAALSQRVYLTYRSTKNANATMICDAYPRSCF